MKIVQYKIVWIFMFFSTFVVGQKHTKENNDKFKVNKDVLVEISTRNTDVTVETWNKNIVSVSSVWEVDGVTEKEASNYFKAWNFEALANKNKVLITLKPSSNNIYNSNFFEGYNQDLSLTTYPEIDVFFDDNHVVEMPLVPDLSIVAPIPPVLSIPSMPITPPAPAFPVPDVSLTKELKFDYDAYIKDKETYLRDFELKQKAWKKEFEEKLEPHLKEYEKKMKKWGAEIKPKIEAYRKRLKEWEKQMKPKMEAREKKLEKRMQLMEKRMQKQYKLKMKRRVLYNSKALDVKKRIIVKVPSDATLKLDIRRGKIDIPDNVKTIR